MLEEIHLRFTYHPPGDQETVDKYVMIRDKAAEYAILIDHLCPDSREKSLAITKLEEVVMWANAAIARRGGD